MAHSLKTEVEELSQFVSQLFDLDTFKNATGDEKALIKRILNGIEKKTMSVKREADNLDVAMEARDANIRALGEKLSMFRMKNAEPFYVQPQRRPSLFQADNAMDWNSVDTASHMKELSDQIARLSLQPAGLSNDEIEEHVADISATRLHETKALNLIMIAKERRLSEGTIRKFLKKKGLPDSTINRCFNQIASGEVKEMPLPPKLMSNYESDSEDQYHFTPKVAS